MLSFKAYLENQYEHIDMKEAERCYERYKVEHENKQCEIFYYMHKDESWFKEKYSPIENFEWRKDRNAHALALATQFVQQAQKGHFAGLRLTASQGAVQEEEQKGKIGEESRTLHLSTTCKGAPFFGFDANACTLYLKGVPVHVSRRELLEAAKGTPGFVSLSLSEPLRTQNFVRYAWISYDDEANCKAAISALAAVSIRGFQLSAVRSAAKSKPVRVTPPMGAGSVARDTELTLSLIVQFNTEKEFEIDEKVFAQAAAGSANSSEHCLDLQLLFLRRVHAFCYYCCEAYEDERMLASKCGPAHVRAPTSAKEARRPRPGFR